MTTIDLTTVVIDNGSGMCKAGIGGEDSPRVSFPAIIGRPKHESVMASAGQKEVFVGEEAQSKRGILSLKYPVSNGIITNWDDMTLIWHQCFYNELRVDPGCCNALLTEAPLNPKQNREKMVDIFFSEFCVNAFYVGIQAVLGLYSQGKTTGLVLDSGDGVTHTVPIYEGFAIPSAVKRLDLAGRGVTEAFQKCLAELGYNLTSSAEFEIVRDLKEKHCYVALDYEEECSKFAKNSQDFDVLAELPDKEIINLKSSTFKGPECLFKPSILGMEAQGISEMTQTTIKKCDLDIRADMYSSIVLTGGTTLLKNIDARIHKDLAQVSSANLKIKVIASPERKYAVWNGASILSSLQTFSTSWINKEEYEEAGPTIVHRRCF